MSNWVTQFITSTGYVGIVLLTLVENVFPPIPSEVIIPLAGFLVSQDELKFLGVIVSCTLGSVLGALLLYYLGYKLGHDRVAEFSKAHGRWFVITADDIERMGRWFNKYGVWAVFFLRLLPGMRSLISIPAGISKMPILWFLLATAIGTALWSAALAGLGFYLGNQFTDVGDYLKPISTAVIGAMVVWYIWQIFKGRNAQ